jgi:hypothetical protein
MKKVLLFLVLFIFVGTYSNYVDRYRTIYTAEPLVAVSEGQATFSPLKGVLEARESNAQIASRSKAQFTDPKSQKAILAYQHYVKENVPRKELSCYFNIIDKESKWNPLAQNPKSTAFGLGQFLNSTWELVDYKKTTDPYVQIDAMIKYVNLVYGDGCQAWDFKKYKGWY